MGRGKSNVEPLSENDFGQAPKLAEYNSDITTNNGIVILLIILLKTIAIEITIKIMIIITIRTILIAATSSEHVEFAAWLRICSDVCHTELPGISGGLYKLLWKDPIGIQQTALGLTGSRDVQL